MTNVGKAYITSLSGGSVTNSKATVTPNITTLRLTDSITIDRIGSMAGVTHGLILSDPSIECSFDFVPEGASVADATTSAGLPEAPAEVTISGLPVVAYGSLADALNTGSGVPWLYLGGGTINGTSEGKWTGTFTLYRYPGISSAAAVT